MMETDMAITFLSYIALSVVLALVHKSKDIDHPIKKSNVESKMPLANTVIVVQLILLMAPCSGDMFLMMVGVDSNKIKFNESWKLWTGQAELNLQAHSITDMFLPLMISLGKTQAESVSHHKLQAQPKQNSIPIFYFTSEHWQYMALTAQLMDQISH